MPEGPEVKLLTKQIKEKLDPSKKWKLENIKVIAGPYKTNDKPLYKKFRNNIKKKMGIKYIDIKNNGKFMYMEFLQSSTPIFLGIGFGLTGRFISSKPNESESKLHKITFTFRNKNGKSCRLYYLDQRNMGRLEWLSEIELQKKLKTFGPDISKKLSSSTIKKALNKFKKYQDKPLVDVLIDQKVLSGIGNYIRADVCYLAKIDPFIKINEMENSDFRKLSKALYRISKETGMSEGSKNYETLTGNVGDYNFYVYSRKKTEKGEKVSVKKLKGRSIYYVAEEDLL